MAPRPRGPAQELLQAGLHPPAPPAPLPSGDAPPTSRPLRSVMLVGWGGNNGTTVTGGILANKQ